MKITSRQDAKNAGAVRYFTGVPCAHGHIAERFASTCGCVVCMGEKAKAWKKANRAKATATSKAWRAANHEKVMAAKKAWNAANPEGQKLRSRRWYLANTERANAQQAAWAARNPEAAHAIHMAGAAARRSALIQRTPAWADRKAIADVYQDAAEFRAAGIEVDVDHEIPLQGELVSGLHVHNNLRVCMSSFNRAKSNTFHI